jgi:hypothetical protein
VTATAAPGAELERLDDVLDGTDAAVYAYGLVAARLDSAGAARALDAMAAHRGHRDVLRARILALGGTPRAAAPAYTPPFKVEDPATATTLAALVEDRLAGQWAALAAASTVQRRLDSALSAQECATRSVTWSGKAPVWNGAT